MSITFSASEIFELAEEIERNGAKFYRKAAEHASERSTKEWLLAMAAMEDGHLQTFSDMRKELSEAERQESAYDPEHEAIMYLDAMADAHGTEGKKGLHEELTGSESIEEILRIAIRSEKDSVVFYSGLKALVPEKAGLDKVDKIIAEELSHITTLGKKLREVQVSV